MARTYLECSVCWPSCAFPQQPKDPERATSLPSRALPNSWQTPRVFFADFLTVFVNSPRQGFSGSHTSTCLPSRETSFRLTQRCFRRHHLETPFPPSKGKIKRAETSGFTTRSLQEAPSHPVPEIPRLWPTRSLHFSSEWPT